MCDQAEHQLRQHKRSMTGPIVVWIDRRFEDELSHQSIPIVALQNLGESIKTVADNDAFVNFITDMEHEYIVAVISDELCEMLVSVIHDFKQIISIYVFYQDDQMKNNELQKNFYKVHSVLNDSSTIIDSLRRETRIIEHNLEEISILDYSGELDVNRLDPTFMYLQIFKELILEIDYNDNTKQEFAEYCHSYCIDNRASLSIVDEIRRNYKEHSPIWWYTRDTFLYRLVNRSLRNLNAMTIWKLRLFIKDLHQALAQLQSSAPVSITKLYRGQR
jgi:hypothetical protein